MKDHLGNVRMVLTSQAQTDIYPIASLEGDDNDPASAISINKQFYQIEDSKVVATPVGAPSFTNTNGIETRLNPSWTSQNSEKMYRLQGSSGGGEAGLGITLKVMGGDKISLFARSYFKQSVSSRADYSIPILSLLEGLLGGGATSGAKGVTAPGLNGVSGINSAVSGFVNQPGRAPSGSTFPKAALNWILFDEQFNVVEECMGFRLVSDDDVVESLVETDITMKKSGYLYVYCSNESDIPVFFDNLQVVHERSRVLEETHYYPFGLTMAGISGKNAGGMENLFRYNGKELQRQELSDNLGLDWYDYGARMYDAQIGRWNHLDPLSEEYYPFSPYGFAVNNPIIFYDEDGRFLGTIIGGVVGGVIGGVRAAIRGDNVWTGVGKGVLSGAAAGAIADLTIATAGTGTLALLAAGALSGATGSLVDQGLDLADGTRESFSVAELTASAAFGSVLTYGGAKVAPMIVGGFRKIFGSAKTGFSRNGIKQSIIPEPIESITAAQAAENLAAKTGTTAFRSFTKSSFRHNLGQLTGNIPANSQAHHVFPQKFQSIFSSKGINIHDPKFGAWWNTSGHLKNASGYNAAWESFLKTNPSQPQIMNYGRQLMGQYGIPVGF